MRTFYDRPYIIWLGLRVATPTPKKNLLVISRQLSIIPHFWNSYYFPDRLPGFKASIHAWVYEEWF